MSLREAMFKVLDKYGIEAVCIEAPLQSKDQGGFVTVYKKGLTSEVWSKIVEDLFPLFNSQGVEVGDDEWVCVCAESSECVGNGWLWKGKDW